MCQVSSRARKSGKVRTIYKVVRKVGDKYKSQFHPNSRMSIGSFNRGCVLEYPIGMMVDSPTGPGIMGYTNLAIACSRAYNKSVLKLRVYPNAIVRTGDNCSARILCASRVKVLGVVK